MRVSDEVRKCVVFVGLKMNNGDMVHKGTAFWLSRDIEDTDYSFMYMVTAKHIINGIKKTGIDTVYLQMNLKGGKSEWVETPLAKWIFHPDDDTVDVAIYPISISPSLDHFTYPLTDIVDEDLISKHQVGVGDEVFITGLFSKHKGRERVLPIVRIGNIAAMPEEPVESKLGKITAYLIEMRSIGGLSGSPVFVNLGDIRARDGELYFAGDAPTYYLLGLVHGHWDVDESEIDEVIEDSNSGQKINIGVAIVIPAIKILEVIQQPKMREEEENIEITLRSGTR